MLLAALVVGLVTAWAYGPRIGLQAAGVALGLFVVAALFPFLSLYAYLVVGVGVAGVATLAARRPRHPQMARALEMGRAVLRRLRSK